MNSEISMKAEEFIDYLEKAKSKSTVRIYKRGLQLFSEYYGKSLDQILEDRQKDLLSSDSKQRKRFVREIEMYHKWLLEEKKYPLNSASSYCDGLMQLFRYFEMPMSLESGSDVRKRVLTTKDFVPRPEQYRDMFLVADNLRDKLIISMGKDLAWRIGDFIQQRKDQLPNLERDPPIVYELITEKEDVMAKSFISEETVELLKQYLPTILEDSAYLFPSSSPNGKKRHIDDWTVNQLLRRLAKKAKIVIPKRKRLRFHAFRKRFLSTCANLSVDINIAKILVGKQVETDMLTYLSEVEHKKAFLRVHQVLRLTEPSKKVVATPKPIAELEEKFDKLERLVYGIIALGHRDVVQEAKKFTGLESMPYSIREERKEERVRLGTSHVVERKEVTIEEIEELMRLGEASLRKQREEYRKLIEANNNNEG